MPRIRGASPRHKQEVQVISSTSHTFQDRRHYLTRPRRTPLLRPTQLVPLYVIPSLPTPRRHVILSHYHESPFGGKLEGFRTPVSLTRTNFKVFSAGHSPLHLSKLDRPSSSRRSGIQKPDLYSRLSSSIRFLSWSSRLDGGRPDLRCAFIVASSSSSRPMKLRGKISCCQGPRPVLHWPCDKVLQFFLSQRSAR